MLPNQCAHKLAERVTADLHKRLGSVKKIFTWNIELKNVQCIVKNTKQLTGTSRELNVN